MHLDDINDIITYYARINIVVYILILGFSFIYFFINEWAKNERIKNHLRAEQLAAELQLLKLQINPHFFFNTLIIYMHWRRIIIIQSLLQAFIHWQI